MLQRVNDTLAGLLEERGLDARTCFTRVQSLPPDGWGIEVEVSDAEAGEELRRRLGLVGEEAKRLRVVVLPREGLPVGLIAASSVADVRKTPAHSAELVTQVVYGDALEPLKSEGEWYLCRIDDQYVGWIRSWHVAEVGPEQRRDFLERSTHRVAANHSVVLSRPEGGALPISDLVVGIPVVVEPGGRRGWAAVELPDGKRGFVRRPHLERHPRRGSLSREKLVATGLRFLGIPYLWGGNTPKGFDCSGLIQRIYRLHGLILPRDSDMQSRFGAMRESRDLDTLLAGDLVFFGRNPERITHVGMVLPDQLFLHAYGQVRVNSLDSSHPLFDAALAQDWRHSRNPLAVAGRK